MTNFPFSGFLETGMEKQTLTKLGSLLQDNYILHAKYVSLMF